MLDSSPYSFDEFVRLRVSEKRWLEMNGYNNGDPLTNGEYAVIKQFSSSCNLLFDIGYNEGEISNYFVKNNPHVEVVGFEPNQCLPSTVTDRKIIRCALTDEAAKTSEFYVHATNPVASSLRPRTDMNPSFRDNFVKTQVSTQRLDDFDMSQYDVKEHSLFLKIDVEGVEAKVLRGAVSLLSAIQPIGYFEYSFGWREADETLQRLYYFLDSINYSCYRVTPFGLEHIRFFHVSMENYMYSNVFFAPKRFVNKFMASESLPDPFGSTEFYRFTSVD